MPTDAETTRFAPSPTGALHLGHVHSALFAARRAGDGGRFIVRLEDIDFGRCRAEFVDAIYDDLAWLGLAWEQPVRCQSEHMNDYADALATLDNAGLLYPCYCTRKDIMAEIAAADSAPHGPDGPLYPGTCRHLSNAERSARKEAGEAFALRLDMSAAVEHACAGAENLTWHDRVRGPQAADPARFGDVVLARKDVPTSYHLAVTVDDHLQGVTLVTRGEDLFEASHVHRLLQALLGLDVPDYEHHGLLTDDSGRRLAKRDKAATIGHLRGAGYSPAEVWRLAGFDEAPA